MRLRLSHFFPMCPAPTRPLTPLTQAMSTLLSASMVTHMYSLATLFPRLYIHPRDYSVTTNFYSSITSPISPIPPTPPPIWQPSKWSLYLWLFLFCLFTLLYKFNCWQICACCHFIFSNFDFLLLLEDPLTFHIMLV